MSREPAPARPPEARLTAKKGQKSVLELYCRGVEAVQAAQAARAAQV
jgi:hypothetical protein